MARRILSFDRRLLRQLRVAWSLDPRGQGIGGTAQGLNQTIFSAFPRWIGTLQLRLFSGEIRQWQATLDELEGRINVLRIPMIDPLGFDWTRAAGAYASSGVPMDEGSTFEDGTGWAYTPAVPATAAAAIGATELSVDTALAPAPIQVGQIMSHDDWPFRVTGIVSVNGTVTTIRVRPALRAAVAAGDPVELEGYGLFELVEDLSGATSYGRNHVALPEVAFQEWITR